MDSVTKESLTKGLQNILEKQRIEAIILETVKEFSHYKQVNKRFIDKLKEKDLRAWMSKDGSVTKVSVTSDLLPHQEGINIRAYNKEITWEYIINELNTYKLKECENMYIERIHTLDKDVEKLKKMLEFIKETKTVNFHYDLDRIVCSLEGAIKYSK